MWLSHSTIPACPYLFPKDSELYGTIQYWPPSWAAILRTVRFPNTRPHVKALHMPSARNSHNVLGKTLFIEQNLTQMSPFSQKLSLVISLSLLCSHGNWSCSSLNFYQHLPPPFSLTLTVSSWMLRLCYLHFIY